MKPLNLTVIAAALLLSAGCKIRIDVPEGGQVVTESGAFDCASGAVCEIDVVDLFFNETFIAEPAAGYRFAGWEKIHRGLCGGSEDPCHLVTSAFEGNEVLMGFLERPEEIFFLNPLFEPEVTEAFDPAIFINNSFRVREEGFTVTYQFSEDGSYSKRAGVIFAEGRYRFELDNTVIHYTRLAETSGANLSGFAVFESFDAERRFYTVCYTVDQGVRSARQAVELCENGASGGIDAPTRLRYSIRG